MQNSRRRTFLVKLFGRHEGRVRRFLLWKGHRNEDVDDLVQETFLRAHKVETWDEIDNPRAFLMRIARNAHNDGLRRKARDVTEDSACIDGLEFGSGQPGPEQVLSGRQELAELEAAINDLTPRTKQAIILVKILNVSYAKASKIMGISVNTLENHIVKGLASCRKRVALVSVPELNDGVVSLAERRKADNKRPGK